MELWIDSRLGIGGSAPFSCHFCLGMRHGLHQVFTICLRRIKLELLSNLCCQWIPHSTKKKEDFNWADKTFAKMNQDQELSKFSFIFRSFVLRSAQLYNMIHIFLKLQTVHEQFCIFLHKCTTGRMIMHTRRLIRTVFFTHSHFTKWIQMNYHLPMYFLCLIRK